MNKFLVVMFVMFISSVGYAQNEEDFSCPEELKVLGKMIFKSVQNENLSDYKKYIVTEQDVDTMAKYHNFTIEEIDMTKAGVRYCSVGSEKDFNRVLKQGKGQGIDWNKAELVDFMCVIRGQEHAPQGELVLDCKYNETRFGILLGVVAIKNEWLLFGVTELLMQGL